MNDKVIYHNKTVRGPLRNAGMSWVTNKGKRSQIGTRVWAIEGEGKPCRYALHGWFIIDDVVEGPGGSVSGSVGRMLSEPVPLNGFPWFQESLKTRWFSFGLQTISDEFAAHLATAAGQDAAHRGVGKGQEAKDRRSRRGSVEPPEAESYIRQPLPATEVSQRHVHLQNALRKHFGNDPNVAKVIAEEDFVDLRVLYKDGSQHFVEIKTCATAREAIREAIGQLLEYRYRAILAGSEVMGVIVAAPAPLMEADHRYLEHLRSVTSLALDYIDLTPLDK